MFFASGLKLSVIGVGLGLPLSVGAAYALATSILGESTIDIATVMAIAGGVIAIGVIAVASFATWIPARRAAGVDALEAIRAD